MAAAVDPIDRAISASGYVSGSGRSQHAVHSGLATQDALRAASAHPGPFVGGRNELPKVVELA